jgi:hypothetical protein
MIVARRPTLESKAWPTPGATVLLPPSSRMTCPVGIAKIRAVTALGAARRCRAQHQPTPHFAVQCRASNCRCQRSRVAG